MKNNYKKHDETFLLLRRSPYSKDVSCRALR